VSLTLQGFDESTKNEKDELFKNSILAYVQYSEEVKQKEKKLAMKIISHAWSTYKSKLIKIWRDRGTPLDKYKDLSKEDRSRFLKKCETEHFVTNSEYMPWL
jgi:uncharacterized protein YaeQ